MTTIAYRDGVIAADTLITSQGTRLGHVTKVGKVGPVLYGAAGAMSLAQRFMDWVRGGMEYGCPMMAGEDCCASGFIVLDDMIVCFDPTGSDRFRSDRYSIGSGADYAMGAMSMGATAEQAVAAAIEHDVHSGGPITVLSRD